MAEAMGASSDKSEFPALLAMRPQMPATSSRNSAWRGYHVAFGSDGTRIRGRLRDRQVRSWIVEVDVGVLLRKPESRFLGTQAAAEYSGIPAGTLRASRSAISYKARPRGL